MLTGSHAPAKIQFVGGKVQENSFPPPPPPAMKPDSGAKPVSKPPSGDKKVAHQADVANGHSAKVTGKTDDIDMKVQDFLAVSSAVDCSHVLREAFIYIDIVCTQIEITVCVFNRQFSSSWDARKIAIIHFIYIYI